MKHKLVGDLGFCSFFIELLVLIKSNLLFISMPDGLKSIEDLTVELDWVIYELRELVNDLL